MLAKKLKDATLEDIRAEQPEVFSAILALGKQHSDEELTAKNAELQAENKDLKAQMEAADVEEARKAKIREVGTKLGASAKAEELVAAGKSVEEATSELIDVASQQRASTVEAFEQTAPETAGDASGDSGEVEVKTFADAVEMIRRRDGSNKATAIRKAAEEFSHLQEALRKGGN